MKEAMDRELFISRQSQRFSFVNEMIKVFFPIYTLNWRANNYVSRQGKGISRRNETTIMILQNVPLGITLIF